MADACTIVPGPTQTCVVCPEQPAVTAVPAKVHVDPQYGWNSSAFSATGRDGDCQTTFSAARTNVGVVCGFANARTSNDPAFLDHAFYMYQEAGKHLRVIIESGVAKTTPEARDVGDTMRIERRGETINYLVNDELVYTSLVPSRGTLRVICCMYAAGDGVD